MNVCAKCLPDYAVADFIESEADAYKCSFCNQENNKQAIAADLDSVIEFIKAGIEREYEDPAESAGYCSEEGGYVGVDILDASDLVSDISDLDEANQDVLDRLIEELQVHDWVKKDPYHPWDDDLMRYTWEEFSEQVKHKIRFVFFRTKLSRGTLPEPYEILTDIGEIVKKLDLVAEIPEGETVYRARQHDGSKLPSTAATLGSPPREQASQSRMSPAGIPMFYGASDYNTAFQEVYSNLNPANSHITLATFKTLKRLRLLDLASIPSIPSIFDSENAHTKMSLSFMQSFERDATRPISAGSCVHYEYVPTQVVAEYFRHVFKTRNQEHLDGIVFKSSKVSGGKCYTFFVDSDGCCDAATGGKVLLLAGVQHKRVDLTSGRIS